MKNLNNRSQSEHSRRFALIFFAVSALGFCLFIGHMVYGEYNRNPLNTYEALLYVCLVTALVCVSGHLWDKAAKLQAQEKEDRKIKPTLKSMGKIHLN